ncbi:ketopantoate reductase family protein [Leptolinea tardivitalis]|nr:ketopantoate reductase family protein [Leptolinea tardivitalis]
MMKEIKRVAILGAGAMGAYFATRFFDSGFETCLIARGQRNGKLTRDGLIVNGKKYLIPVVDPDTADSPVDLIIVALKHHHLQEAARGLNKLVGNSTVFLSVMNGLESEEILGSFYGMEKVVYAISLGIDAVRVENQIVFTTPGIHYFGEAKNETHTPRVEQIRLAFEKAGIAYKIPEDMMRWLWWKFMVNVGINQASAVTRMRYAAFQKSPTAQQLMESLMREVIILAQAAGIDLTEEDITNWYPVLNRLSPDGKTSMLQDIEAGQKTEVEVFSGKVIALGKQYGIPTPVNETVFRIIKLLEQGYGVQ